MTPEQIDQAIEKVTDSIWANEDARNECLKANHLHLAIKHQRNLYDLKQMLYDLKRMKGA